MLQARMHVTFLSHLAAANATIAEGDEHEHENEESDSGNYSLSYTFFSIVISLDLFGSFF